ncbi:MAG: TonB-dependent receptor [Deltaproteobacteria bacterium]|nr:TonB-dependent receptor [Nannocystaceae bacterium]
MASTPEIRVVHVDTDALRGSTRAAAFRHAGARTVVSMQDAISRGAGSLGEALDRVPGVRAPDGIAGSSGPTKLNVAVRGASPRLGEDATVLLDEVPISMAPYGLPQLSLFPISLFSIDRVDAARSGASVRFGPTTVGGVFNLVSKPIPLAPEIRVASRVDQWGSFSGGASFGTTAGKLGVYAEYAPQAGRTYRSHSAYAAHGGLLKLAYAFGPRVELHSTTHGYHEDSELPGGLRFSQYDRDPFQSVRPDDGFRGWRVGEALKLRVRPKPNHELALIGWYNRSFRQISLQHPSQDTGFVELPRDYHVVGIEPRYVVRLKHKRGPFHDLSFGIRGVFEAAHQRRFETPPQTGTRMPTDDENTRLGALAFYVEDELYLADESVVLRAGVRGELARLSRRENLDPERPVLSNSYFQALPSASLRYDPIDELGVFLGYSRSFKAPSFVTIGIVPGDTLALRPVLADSVEAGIKIAELAGLYGEATGWFRNYTNLLDEGEASVDVIGDWIGGGVELDLEWEPGELWAPLVGSSLYGGYAFTESSIYDSPFDFNGNRLPWFPRHELWSGFAYAFPWRCSFFESLPGPDDCRLLKLGADLTHSGAQYSYFDEDPTLTLESGATGGIPAYTLVDVYLKFQTLLPRAWTLNLSLGIKNVADTSWFYRTDDLNRGILAQRPRTFFVGLDIGYTFFDAHRRAEARRARRAETREQR